MGQRTPYRIYFTGVKYECQEELYKRNGKIWENYAKVPKVTGTLTRTGGRDKMKHHAGMVELGSEPSAAGGG